MMLKRKDRGWVETMTTMEKSLVTPPTTSEKPIKVLKIKEKDAKGVRKNSGSCVCVLTSKVFLQRSWQVRQWRQNRSRPVWPDPAQSEGCYQLSHLWGGQKVKVRNRKKHKVHHKALSTVGMFKEVDMCWVCNEGLQTHLWIILWECR